MGSQEEIFVLTKDYFEKFFDPNAELHRRPLESLKDAVDVADALILEFSGHFGGTSKTQLAYQLLNWYNAEALMSCNCMYCKNRRKNEKAQGRG